MKATSEYLNRPTLTERERALVDALRDLIEKTPAPATRKATKAWDTARAILAELS